tara:strand:+ start:196 stop:312 length:117 start_codon:yes stop_codon:yes gene_type:complete
VDGWGWGWGHGKRKKSGENDGILGAVGVLQIVLFFNFE